MYGSRPSFYLVLSIVALASSLSCTVLLLLCLIQHGIVSDSLEMTRIVVPGVAKLSSCLLRVISRVGQAQALLPLSTSSSPRPPASSPRSRAYVPSICDTSIGAGGAGPRGLGTDQVYVWEHQVDKCDDSSTYGSNQCHFTCEFIGFGDSRLGLQT